MPKASRECGLAAASIWRITGWSKSHCTNRAKEDLTKPHKEDANFEWPAPVYVPPTRDLPRGGDWDGKRLQFHCPLPACVIGLPNANRHRCASGGRPWTGVSRIRKSLAAAI